MSKSCFLVEIWMWEIWGVQSETMHRTKKESTQKLKKKRATKQTSSTVATGKRNTLYWLKPPFQGQWGGKNKTQKTFCKTAWNSPLICLTHWSNWISTSNACLADVLLLLLLPNSVLSSVCKLQSLLSDTTCHWRFTFQASSFYFSHKSCSS